LVPESKTKRHNKPEPTLSRCQAERENMKNKNCRILDEIQMRGLHGGDGGYAPVGTSLNSFIEASRDFLNLDYFATKNSVLTAQKKLDGMILQPQFAGPVY
jgi:hypothetical protein